MFGAHLSIAGGLQNALLMAEQYGFDTVQLFTKSQRQWSSPPLTDEAVRIFRAHARRLGFTRVVAHASYLINLASPDDTLWDRSVALTQDELDRCHALAIPFLVVHPGAHMGSGVEPGLARVADAIDRLHFPARASSVTLCLEVTAGQGSGLGHTLEQLADIRGQVKQRARVGYCLDTAHLFAAGYDFRQRRYAGFREQVDRVLGISNVHVLHVNDSMKELGSKVDRHAHVGEGHIGLNGFSALVNDPAFVDTPKIIETPGGKAADGRSLDIVNVERLRGLRKRRARRKQEV